MQTDSSLCRSGGGWRDMSHASSSGRGDGVSHRPSQSPPGAHQGVTEHISERHLLQDGCRECAALRDVIEELHEEKEEALREQRRTFKDRLDEIAENRKRLEEERMVLLRRKLEQEMEEKMQVLIQNWKIESLKSIEEACEETRREAESERALELQRVQEKAESRYKERLKEAVSVAKEEERKILDVHVAEMEIKHQEALQAIHEKVHTVQEQLKDVKQEKMDFECKFKELQRNYKRFIDLTDSALHSDYLLRLIRLGKPPGYAHGAVQTEDVI